MTSVLHLAEKSFQPKRVNKVFFILFNEDLSWNEVRVLQSHIFGTITWPPYGFVLAARSDEVVSVWVVRLSVERGEFIFVLPRIVIESLLNNQPDALIIPNLFCYKILHVSGISSAHHQEFSTVHSALAYVIKTCITYTSAECTVENSWWWAE